MEEVKSIDWFMSEIDRAMDILEQDPDVKKHADEQRRPKGIPYGAEPCGAIWKERK